MGKTVKLTYEYVKNEFEKRGYELLETEYIDSATKMRYKCLKHPDKELSIKWNNFKTGYGCPHCAGNAKYTYKEVNVEFNKRGYFLLEHEYKNNQTPMSYQCPKHPDKELKIRFRDFMQGKGCSHCAGNVKYEFTFVENEFENRGYILLSQEYEGANKLLKYICKDHESCGEQDITFSSFLKGSGCKYCGIEVLREKMRKYDYKYVKQTIEDEGYVLQSKQYRDTRRQLTVICPNSHIWKTDFTNFLEGTRCKKCSNERNAELRKKILEMFLIVSQ